MSKDKFADYDSTAASNTDVGGVNIQGSAAISNGDNALRELMSHTADHFAQDTISDSATPDLGANAAHYLVIAGTTTQTAYGTVKAGTLKFCEYSGARTLTHNATSFILPGGANITTAAGDTALWVSEGSGNWRCLSYMRAATSPVRNVTRGHIFGLTLSNNGTDATNDIDIAAGEAASTDNPAVLMVLASALTKRLDAAWAVGTGNGGLDTGSIANTTYHVWLIRRSDTGVVDALFSTSVSAPTMPTSYDQKRRIGSIVRSGATILAFHQKGDWFSWDDPPLDINQTAPGTSAVNATLTVPGGLRVAVTGNTTLNNDTDKTSVYFFDPHTNNEAVSLAAGPLAQLRNVVNGITAVAQVSGIYTSTVGQINYRCDVSTAATVVRWATVGWMDSRSRHE